MRAATVVLLISFCTSSLGQGRQVEANIHFHAGLSEQLVTSCRAADKVMRSVGSTMSTMDLLEEFKKSGTCTGFIQGVLDHETITTTDENGHPAGRHFCVPAEASSTQLAKIVVKYGDDHPQQLHLPAVIIVLLAMGDAFPCR